MRKNKMLFITWRCPYPLISGAEIRIFNNLKILSEKYEIDMIIISELNINNQNQKELEKYCKEIKIFNYSKLKFNINLIRYFFNKDPLQCNYYYFKEVKEWILKNEKKYDKIFFNHIRTSKYAEDLDREKLIIDFVDAISMNFKNGEKNTKGLKNLIYKIENKRLLKYEKKISELIKKIIIISEIDKKYLIDNGLRKEIEVIGNFVTLKYDKKIAEENNINNVKYILFLGKMNYEPNVSAVKYFSENIYTKLKLIHPEVEFWIAGNSPSKEVKKLENISGIKVLGYVDSREKILRECEIFIAPMISGSGIQNKILEAMDMKKVVITTLIGKEGLDNLIGNELIVCKNAKDILKDISELLNNDEKKNLIGKNAKNYIQKNYSYNSISNKMLLYLERE